MLIVLIIINTWFYIIGIILTYRILIKHYKWDKADITTIIASLAWPIILSIVIAYEIAKRIVKDE